MSEGLLYTQIKSHLTEEVSSGDWAITTDNLFDILDDLKEDCPTVNIHNMSDLLKFAKWYFKWFGKSP
jgi:hypothetical protein